MSRYEQIMLSITHAKLKSWYSKKDDLFLYCSLNNEISKSCRGVVVDSYSSLKVAIINQNLGMRLQIAGESLNAYLYFVAAGCIYESFEFYEYAANAYFSAAENLAKLEDAQHYSVSADLFIQAAICRQRLFNLNRGVGEPGIKNIINCFKLAAKYYSIAVPRDVFGTCVFRCEQLRVYYSSKSYPERKTISAPDDKESASRFVPDSFKENLNEAEKLEQELREILAKKSVSLPPPLPGYFARKSVPPLSIEPSKLSLQ